MGRTGVRETKRGIAPYDGQSTVERDIDQIGQEMQRLDRKTEYAHRGLDYDSQRLEEKQRELAAQLTLHSNGNDEPNARNVGERTEVQNGNQRSNKKSDNYFGK